MKHTLVLISCLLLLPTSALAANSHLEPKIKLNNQQLIAQDVPLPDVPSPEQIQEMATNITVKVSSNNNGGTGVIIAKKQQTYLIVTNAHVVAGSNKFQIQTSDGVVHQAQLLANSNLSKYDLALVEFSSNKQYKVAQINNSTPKAGMPVLGVGFSAETGKLTFREGKTTQVPEQAFKGGYQIGYSSDIVQGMSGGAILDNQGGLMGINGRSTYPIINSGFVYADGARPTAEEIQQFRRSSWGIPFKTFLAQVNPEILTAYSLPLPQSTPSIPPVASTGWLADLEQKAKQFSVRIDSSSNANGSGVIIAKQGDVYTVLTADHVLCERVSAKEPCGNNRYQILAPNNQLYPIIPESVNRQPGVDLAVVKFSSKAIYQVATLADYNPNNFELMFTAGYPKLGDKSPWRFTIGLIYEKEQGLLQTKESDFSTNSSGQLKSASSLTGGYELVYTSITYGGMSGGAVLDSQGRVIGIHGRAEGEQAIDQKTGDRGINGDRVQMGYSLGIPISTFLGLVTRLKLQPPKVETTPPPQLNPDKIQSIEDAVLSANVSQGNATASTWLERGNQLWRLRQYKEAVKAFDQAIKLKPDFVYLAYYGKGIALLRDGNDLEAVAALEKAVQLEPNFVAAWERLSVVYQELGQPEKALAAINQAIQLQANNPNLYNGKFSVLNYLKRYDEALDVINIVIKLNPRATFYSNRGSVYYNQEKRELAIADYTKAIEINPKYATAYNNRGIVYYNQEKRELAIADYTKAIEINPKLAEAYNNRGNVYKKQEKRELAIADYNKAIEINPKLAEAYNNRGNVYKKQEKWELAIVDYTQAIEINPRDADAYSHRGLVYDNQEKWELAIADYTQAIEINPKLAEVYINRGIIYKKQEKWELAIVDYTQAIKINPKFAEAYYNRGVLYFEQKKWDLALADYNQAIQFNDKLAQAYYNRGVVYYNQEKWELAIADYNRAIEINPQYAQAYANRGLVYVNRGDKQKAIADLQTAATLFQQQGNTQSYEWVIGKLQQLQG
ncbi:MAG TPA: tetratricopeptide repeat protein [Oculatellaceae cyanobacterium]